MRLYERDIPVDVLTAVVDGDVVFGTRTDAAVGRAAVTSHRTDPWAGCRLCGWPTASGAAGTRVRCARR
jgi:hypothetical protein